MPHYTLAGRVTEVPSTTAADKQGYLVLIHTHIATHYSDDACRHMDIMFPLSSGGQHFLNLMLHDHTSPCKVHYAVSHSSLSLSID